MKDKIESIKLNIEKHIGSRVRVTSKRSRKKIAVRQGVIESTYPNIFVIKYDALQSDTSEKRVSFSYVDVLTHAVELAVYKEKAV